MLSDAIDTHAWRPMLDETIVEPDPAPAVTDPEVPDDPMAALLGEDEGLEAARDATLDDGVDELDRLVANWKPRLRKRNAQVPVHDSDDDGAATDSGPEDAAASEEDEESGSE